MFDIITIGDATLDTFLIIDDDNPSCSLDTRKNKLMINYADKIPIANTAQSVGGNAANVAVGMKKLGMKSAIITELGDDINGLYIKEQLEDAGVDTSLVKVLKGKESRYSIVLNYKSERTILCHHVTRKYTLPKIPKTDWIYYTSLGESFGELQDKVVDYLKKHPGTKLAVNPGSHQRTFGMKKLKQILPMTDLLFVNKEEAELFVGKKSSVKSLIKALCKAGCGTVVLTDGKHGSYASDGKTIYFMKTYPMVAKAKTGAGDAYASGFLTALHKDRFLPEAMQWGSASAAGVLQEIGAQHGLLNQKQLQTIVKKYPSVKPKRFL